MRRRTMFGLILTAAWLMADTGAGVKWTPPATWKAEGERPMRLATYTIAPVAGDKDPGECIVNYFGAGQGGSVEMNVDRWLGQMNQPDGKPSKSVATVEKRTVKGLKVTLIDVSGSYTGMGGPRAPQGGPKAGYRMLGAIIEGPQGTVFFKFTGPVKTVAQNKSQWDKLIASLGPA